MAKNGAKTRIGINGFGRIGRQLFRIIETKHADTLSVVAINSLADSEQLAHLLKYDSTYGRFEADVVARNDGMVVDGRPVRVFSERDPAAIPWEDADVAIVIESTGVFTSADQAAGHLARGPKKVIISGPAKGEDITIVMGVNDDRYDPATHHIISNASCTTNCVAPIVQVVHDAFGIEQALMSTVHSYTNDQRILDKAHKDLRRARSAANNIIPTTTGAARAVTQVIPELAGKIDGMAYRVPTVTGSVVDLTARLSKATDVDGLNQAFRDAAARRLYGILAVSDAPLVSSDYIGDEHSCTLDALSTSVVQTQSDGRGTFVKVVGWYDNEWGYSSRMADVTVLVADQL